MGLYAAQQLQLEEVLTQAICAPVASAQAAEAGMAAERQETRAFTTTQTQDTRGEGYSRKTQLSETNILPPEQETDFSTLLKKYVSGYKINRETTMVR